jgi:L-fuculose-phosphate aldolase
MGEIYTGIKFEVIHLPEEKIADFRIGKLIGIGMDLAAKGFCPGNSGNLSFRYALGFVITRAGSELGKLTPRDFILVTNVNIGKKRVFVAGKAEPSSEAMMHSLIYAARPDVNAILHAHALNIKDAIVTAKAHPYGTVEFAESAVDILRQHDKVILKDHGFVSTGMTVDEAFSRIQ